VAGHTEAFANPGPGRRNWYQQEIRQRCHQDPDSWELAEHDAGFNIFAAPGPAVHRARAISCVLAAPPRVRIDELGLCEEPGHRVLG
jgi:hypothetical protein